MRFQIRILIIRSRLSLAPIAALHILARVDEAPSVRYRFLVDGVRRHWISMKASLGIEELEDRPPQGRFLRIVDVDPVHVSNEPPAPTRLKKGTHHGRDLLGSSVPRRAFVSLSLTVAPCAPPSTFALNAESRPRIQSSNG